MRNGSRGWRPPGWSVFPLVLLLTVCARAPYPATPEPDPLAYGQIGGLFVPRGVLLDRLIELTRRSATWRAGLDSLRQTGFRVLIAEPTQVRQLVRGLERYSPEHFGEVLPLYDDGATLAGAVVTVDVARLTRLYREAGLPESMLHSDIDRILVHEVYGHVLPLARARRVAGGCPDPRAGKPASASCAIQRENRIRRELGVEPRLSYDISGLLIGQFLAAQSLLSGER